MHELALAESVLQMIDDAAQANGFHRVRKIVLEIGQLAAVDPAAMRFCFDAVVRETVADGAVLEIEEIPGVGWCADCAAVVPMDDFVAACPQCGRFAVQSRSGRELRLKTLEVE